MNARTRLLMHAIVFAVGLILLIGGAVTGTPGAVVIGIVVAAVNFGQWKRETRTRPSDGGGEPSGGSGVKT